MCCEGCSETQRKFWVFGFGTLLVALGAVTMAFWPGLADNIVKDSLTLKEGTDTYKNWIEAPIPIYLEFYMFNWTNPEEIRNPDVKPHFVEMGPYVFLEKHLKENYTFFENHTVSYYERRTWFFDAERSNGTLDDMVTAAHVITATVADQMRHRNKFIKKIINFMLNNEGGKLHVTKPVREWIFDGYQDDLVDFLNLFNTTKINIPYKRFGWLADRNNSLEYDGLFTIHTGVDNNQKIGRLTHWNGRNETGFYEPPCGVVNGTTGDLFPPEMDMFGDITIFATDACRYLNLKSYGRYDSRYGLAGVEWVGTEETLDSGENFPNQKCFCDPRVEECPKTGVVECKKCRENAPIYASFPHFYLADDSYIYGVDGMRPQKSKHEFKIAIEPNLGIPLEVNARIQINMMMEPDDSFDIYRGVNKVLMPMFWFNQRAELSEELTRRAQLALNLGDYGVYAGIGVVVFGSLFFVAAFALSMTKRWKRIPQEDEAMLTN